MTGKSRDPKWKPWLGGDLHADITGFVHALAHPNDGRHNPCGRGHTPRV